MIIPLGHPLPDASRDPPGRRLENAWRERRSHFKTRNLQKLKYSKVLIEYFYGEVH